MSAERLSVRKLREFLRLHLEVKLSGRGIARSLGISPSTAQGYVSRIRAAGLKWPLGPEFESEEALGRILFAVTGETKDGREPDWPALHLEMKKKHVTKQLVWEEYKVGKPNGYQYSSFCQLYLKWAGKLQMSMRQEHRVGEKLFIDFSGDGIDVVDEKTGEVQKAVLFVAVLGASSYTYVEPVLKQDLPTWVQCHVNALNFFGGATEIWVPDNLKAGVIKPDRYEPELNVTYRELAAHYGVAILPARVRKPKDKAKVEGAVLVAQRWIIAALRHHTFFSLDAVKTAVKPLLEKLNAKEMRHVKQSRRQLFETLDAPALKALPKFEYEFSQWAQARVGPNYHVSFNAHFYSVPHALLHQEIEIRATAKTVEILAKGIRVAAHMRNDIPHQYSTLAAHMPMAHREYAEWTPERLTKWAEKVGPNCVCLVTGIMSRKQHPQQGFTACMGVVSLSNKFGVERVEAACARAVKANAFSYKSVKAVLRNGLEMQPLEVPNNVALPTHENIRGPGYFN